MHLVFVASLFVLLVPVECDTGYRLPNEYEVISYQIDLTPYLDTGDEKQFTMDGGVNILIRPKYEDLNTITIHSKNLTFIETTLTGETTQRPNVTFNHLYDFAILHLQENLVKGDTYNLEIKYKGPIQDSLHGFYRSSYEENNVTKWLAATQFEAIHAREAFPCFDEPQYKATFELSITRPSNLSNSLSNMPIKSQVISGDTTTDIFHPTPKMSTYLLAFVVSEFQSPNYENNTGKPFGVWSTPESGNRSKYAFDMGRKFIEKMGEYVNLSYYDMADNMKMDLAAIPDIAPLAMENWGLVTFHPFALLLSDEYDNREFITSVIAHELAHQWFGNLVTCHWWSDIWLNEGFASYFHHELLNLAGENFDQDYKFVRLLQAALKRDASKDSKPLTDPNVSSPEEIYTRFGYISYNKGASVIRMMKHLIGEDTFQKGLKYYLNDRKYDVATPEDLFAALNAASVEDGSMSRYGKIMVGDVMETWTKNRGFPLVTVSIDRNNGDITITQEQFKKREDRSDEILYSIPISYTSSSDFSFDDTKPDFILTTKNVTLRNIISGDEYILLNKQATGYYRVNYDKYTWSLIKDDLMNNREKIHKFNRYQISKDMENLEKEGYITDETRRGVLEFLKYETEFDFSDTKYSNIEFSEHFFPSQSYDGVFQKGTEKSKLACGLGHKACNKIVNNQIT